MTRKPRDVTPSSGLFYYYVCILYILPTLTRLFYQIIHQPVCKLYVFDAVGANARACFAFATPIIDIYLIIRFVENYDLCKIIKKKLQN